VHWAEFALGPDAQRVWPTPVASARPTATRPTASTGRSARDAGPARPRPGGAWRTERAHARRTACGDASEARRGAVGRRRATARRRRTERRGGGGSQARSQRRATAGAMRLRQRRDRLWSERRDSDSGGRDGGCRAAA
jgi:hypothetical protein